MYILNFIKKFWKMILILAVAIVIIVTVFIVVNNFYFIKAGKDTSITIKKGDTSREIGLILKEKGVIKSDFLFSVYVKIKNWYLYDGFYEIKSDMNLSQIANMIHGNEIKEVVVTVPEGWRITQIDELLTEKKLIQKGEFLAITKGEEGTLFPDTYRIPLDMSVQGIREVFLNNYKKRTAGLNLTKDQLIMASIVEREARADADRSKIAGVYYNRLKAGMKLDADPTVQYAKGTWSQIKLSDYKSVISPYNTYINKGLPPGPICNPGLKSMNAVVNPEKNNYYFFFHTKDGTSIFSKTYEEHLANLKKYQ